MAQSSEAEVIDINNREQSTDADVRLLLHLVQTRIEDQNFIQITSIDSGRAVGHVSVPLPLLMQAQMSVLNGQPVTIELQRSN